MDSGAEMARRLQAEFDAESASPSPYVRQSTASSSAGRTDMNDDAMLARSLQNENLHEKPTHQKTPQYSQAVGSSTSVSSIAQYGRSICQRTCTGCGKRCISSPQDTINLFKQWFETPVSSAVRCKNCSKHACFGCGRECSSDNLQNEVDLGSLKIYWCCDDGRLFVIWALLCGSDYQFGLDAGRAASFQKQHNNRRKQDSTGGVGYGDEIYSRGMFEVQSAVRTAIAVRARGEAQAAETRQQIDQVTDDVVFLINQLLPQPGGRALFDSSPPPVLTTILLSSVILDKMAELLRNDSLEDAARRYSVYDTAMNFVWTVGSHPSIGPTTILQERNSIPQGCNLLTATFGSRASLKGKNNDKMQSIASCLKNLDTQASMIMSNATKHRDAFQGQGSQYLLELCQRITEVTKYILPRAAPESVDQGSTWVQWQKERSIASVSVEQILASHSCARAQTGYGAPNRTRRIILELTNMKTSLPPGIFLRYSDTRLDLMKILIVGPGGSPYEHGLFSFDLFCGPQYPNEPPKMQFRQTFGGTVHFNPNLHADGKVCLSLLGTWAGEPWNPHESTIQQVLISIQAMIFCEEPLCNEPNYDRFRHGKESQLYNGNTHALTLKYAIKPWLEGKGDPIWKDIVKEHFSRNAGFIIKTIEAWDQADKRIVPLLYHAAAPLNVIKRGALVNEMPQLVQHVKRVLQGSSIGPQSARQQPNTGSQQRTYGQQGRGGYGGQGRGGYYSSGGY